MKTLEEEGLVALDNDSAGYTGVWQCDLGARHCKVEKQVTLKKVVVQSEGAVVEVEKQVVGFEVESVEFDLQDFGDEAGCISVRGCL